MVKSSIVILVPIVLRYQNIGIVVIKTTGAQLIRGLHFFPKPTFLSTYWAKAEHHQQQ